MTGLYDRSFFKFLRHLCSVLHNGCTSLHSDKQYIRSFSSVPAPKWTILEVLDNAIVASMSYSHLIGYICISPKACNPEHLFMCP